MIHTSATCSICGGGSFTSHKVLWPALIAEWRLSETEAAYIDEQQGCACDGCGANLRIVALGDAVRCATGFDKTIRAFAETPEAARLRILDLNGAPAISPALAALPEYVRADYPKVDMLAMPFADGVFDLVIHSDTLEHVPHPVRALQECQRVLAPGGSLCFTVPVVVGRLTRNRDGLPKSYHGDPATCAEDLLVQTEFGADAWRFLFEAGFREIAMHAVKYPAAIAFRAIRSRWTDI
ncbi:MAG: methyltransferase domain-containing protein [Methylocystis sp.]|nr:methyltransferase domain-containing protein [Methylocystis sp.]